MKWGRCTLSFHPAKQRPHKSIAQFCKMKATRCTLAPVREKMVLGTEELKKWRFSLFEELYSEQPKLVEILCTQYYAQY